MLQPETMINGECFLGRSRHCGIVLPSSEVSRVHGCISRVKDEYYFTDLASLGGSRLNHNEVNVNQKYPLKVEDIIRIGEFILTVEAIEKIEVAPAPLSSSSQAQPQKAAGPQGSAPPSGFVLEIPPAELVAEAPVVDPKTYMPVSQIPIDQIGTWAKGDLAVRCVNVISETPDAKTFRFAADPPILFNYQPGQFVTLKLEIEGKSVKRSYSISSTPSRPHTLEITVKRVPAPSDAPDASPGLVSNWLHDNMRVGNSLTLSGPLGKFTCFAHPSPKLLFISAGSGVTPMMSMSRWMMDTAAKCDVIFFHNARTPKDIIFWKELGWMSSHNPNFQLAISVTQPSYNQEWWGLRGRLNEPMLYAIAPDFWTRTVYVCGPDGFMKAVKTMMQGLGFPMKNYYEESFGGAKTPKKGATTTTPKAQTLSAPAAPTAAIPVVAPTSVPVSSGSAASGSAASGSAASGSAIIVFATSGKEVKCDGQEPILDVAEAEGIEMDSSCRSGTCGTCKILKREGTVNYEGEPEALDDEEQEQGYILACIACPVGKVVVEA